MRVKTSIGEIGLEYGSRAIVLRPSLAAMDSLGDPEEIVKLFSDLFSRVPEPTRSPEYNALLYKEHWEKITWTAYAVIAACADEDITDFIGYQGERYGSFKQGKVPLDNLVPIARSLLKHGIVGDVERDHFGEQENGATNSTPRFDARVFVSMATTNLGYSEAEAWNMTVTSFILAAQAKGGKRNSNTPPKEHVEGIAEWSKLVEAARELKRGGKEQRKTMTEAEFDAAMAKVSRGEAQ